MFFPAPAKQGNSSKEPCSLFSVNKKVNTSAIRSLLDIGRGVGIADDLFRHQALRETLGLFC